MKFISAKDAKSSFGLLLDSARAGPVNVEKHGRPVVVVMSIEEFERLRGKKFELATSSSAEEEL
jgi:prevent-host-death family protein